MRFYCSRNLIQLEIQGSFLWENNCFYYRRTLLLIIICFGHCGRKIIDTNHFLLSLAGIFNFIHHEYHDWWAYFTCVYLNVSTPTYSHKQTHDCVQVLLRFSVIAYIEIPGKNNILISLLQVHSFTLPPVSLYFLSLISIKSWLLSSSILYRQSTFLHLPLFEQILSFKHMRPFIVIRSSILNHLY